jgi:hypothetical protein
VRALGLRAYNPQQLSRVRLIGEDKRKAGVKFVSRGSRGDEMAHRLLLNPFHSGKEQVKTAGRQAMPDGRATPVCANCGSDDIISHATAQWSNENQEWELASTFAQPAHCNSCNGPCDIVWLPLN